MNDFHVFDDFIIRNGEATYMVEGGGKIAEVKLANSPKPDLALLDELIAYKFDDTDTQKPLSAELLDWNLDSAFDKTDLDSFVGAYWESVSDDSFGGSRLVIDFLHPDLLLNSSYITDSEGDLVHHAVYMPYGEKVSSHGVSSSRGFGGSLVEEDLDLGAMRMGVRFYASGLGRWTTPDPLFFMEPNEVVKDVMQSNPYAYAANNPMLFIDINGYVVVKVMGGVGKEIGDDAYAKVSFEALIGFEYDSEAKDNSTVSLVGQAGLEASFAYLWSYKKEVSFKVPLVLDGIVPKAEGGFEFKQTNVLSNGTKNTKFSQARGILV